MKLGTTLRATLITLPLVAALTACGSHSAAQTGAEKADDSKAQKAVDSKAQARALASQSCRDAAAFYKSNDAMWNAENYGSPVPAQAKVNAAAGHMNDAIEHARQAGQLDNHWLELAHITEDNLSILAEGRMSYFTVAKWCDAESL
jgi:hypothetical protein